jgi:hypothetical protein
MAATRARRRRGLRKLSVEVHEDELRAIALKGYEGAATTDRRRQAEAVFFFIASAHPPFRFRSARPVDNPRAASPCFCLEFPLVPELQHDLSCRSLEGFQAPLCLSAPPVYWLKT